MPQKQCLFFFEPDSPTNSSGRKELLSSLNEKKSRRSSGTGQSYSVLDSKNIEIFNRRKNNCLGVRI